MLELFLKLVDRVIQLQRHRIGKKTELFEMLVQPSFDEISAIYNDYRVMMINARQLVERGDLEEAISRLKLDREEYLAVRTKLVLMATALKPQSHRDRTEKQVDFDGLVSTYLYEIAELILARAEQEVPSGSQTTALLNALTFLSGSELPLGQSSHDASVTTINNTLDIIEARFNVVATLYGQLRAAAYLGEKITFARTCSEASGYQLHRYRQGKND